MSDLNLHGSRRLTAIAEMAAELAKMGSGPDDRGNKKEIVLADIGTDHAYLPIALCEAGVIKRAIAADIKEGPLKRAKGHIAEAGLADRIEVRQSDGLSDIRPNEADIITICGMGGELVLSIIGRGLSVARESLLVLSPQSKLYEFRRGLRGYGFSIIKEDFVEEDGKYYPVMAIRAADKKQGAKVVQEVPSSADGPPGEENGEALRELYDRYGYDLLAKRHPVLLSYLKQEEKRLLAITERIKGQRAEEIARKLYFCRQALQRMEDR